MNDIFIINNLQQFFNVVFIYLFLTIFQVLKQQEISVKKKYEYKLINSGKETL